MTGFLCLGKVEAWQTMKTYADVGPLPLAATVRGLPSIGASQILVAHRLAVSPADVGLKDIKLGRTVGNIDRNHEASAMVTFGREFKNWRREGDSNPRYDSPLHI